VSSLLFAGGFLAIAWASGSDLLGLLAWLVLAEMFGTRLLDLALQSFQAWDALHGTAHINVAAALARTVAAALFVSSNQDTARAWGPVYALVMVGVGAIGLVIVVGRLGRPTLRGATWRDDLRVGPFFALGQASKTIYGDVDKYMLLHYVGSTVAGNFTAAYRLVTFAFVPVQALVYSNNTTLFRAGVQGVDASWRTVRELWTTTMAGAGIGACGLLIAAPLAPHVLGSGYGPTTTMLLVLAVLPLIQAAHYLLGDALMGLGRQSVRSIAQVVAASANIALNFALIPHFSWRGAVASTFFCEGALGIAFFMMLRRELRGGGSAR
jgi:O-antigen/teichoic acid export membrane protein